MDQRIQHILDHYGPHAQLIKAKEELLELVKAIDDFLRHMSQSTVEHVAEEVADVEIMIAQVRAGLVGHDRVERWKAFELDRQMRRIREEEKELDMHPDAVYARVFTAREALRRRIQEAKKS